MSVIFTFPGQGAQHAEMLAGLPDSKAVQDTLAQASETLQADLHDLVSAEGLKDTRSVQLALTIAGVAAARHLTAEAGMPDAVLGLSIGAWPAAVVAGTLDFADALRLVAERGRLMAMAYPEGYGMLAIIGLTADRVAVLLANRGHQSEAYLANINADQQIVVAGSDAALAEIEQAARAAGARRALRLCMAVPSHCSLMDGPAGQLFEVAQTVDFRAPEIAFFSANRKRRLWTGAELRDDLIFNMARTVYWADTARIAIESGYRLSLQMPPGCTLTGLHPATEEPSDAMAIARSGWANGAALMRKHHDSV
ncbi:MAG: malonate decarboxylase subunit epsilon [Salinisphaera sp.]|jgi:malonate decarboxylase epsilon subunit|nr:malonate decarboxylase subunit epsilon [Salinisphaera sp.]